MKKNKIKAFLYYLGQYLVRLAGLLLKAATISFFIFFFAENFKTGIISNYFDLNFLLVLVIISGLAVIIFNDK